MMPSLDKMLSIFSGEAKCQNVISKAVVVYGWVSVNHILRYFYNYLIIVKQISFLSVKAGVIQFCRSILGSSSPFMYIAKLRDYVSRMLFSDFCLLFDWIFF